MVNPWLIMDIMDIMDIMGCNNMIITGKIVDYTMIHGAEAKIDGA